MKKIRSIMETALDKFSDILLPVFVIGMFIYVFYHELTKEKPIDQAIIGIFHNIRENIIIIIISIALGTFLVFIFMKIKRNKNNIFFPKMNVLYIFLAATIWMTLILIRSKPFYPATLLIPLVFLLLIIQGITEYYKIKNETLYVKKGIVNKTEVINIKEIASIGLWTDNSGEGSETFVVIYLHNNKIIKLREKIEGRNVFIKKLLEINKHISTPVYDEVKFKKYDVILGKYIYDDLLNDKDNKIFGKIVLALILIIFFSIDFYILLNMMVN